MSSCADVTSPGFGGEQFPLVWLHGAPHVFDSISPGTVCACGDKELASRFAENGLVIIERTDKD